MSERAKQRLAVSVQSAHIVQYKTTVHAIGDDFTEPVDVPSHGKIPFDWHLQECTVSDDRVIALWYRHLQ